MEATRGGVTHEMLYSGLPSAVAKQADKLGLPAGSSKKKEIVQSFLKRHLPANRLLANEDDITFNTVPLSNPPRKKKKFDITKGKKKKLTHRERHGMKLFKIPKENQTYSQHLVLHEAWKQYMEELIPTSSLSSPGAMQAACQKVVKADLQGSVLTVRRSKCPSLVGLTGIVLQESRHTFTLVTPHDTVKCVPKMNCIFVFEFGGHVFTIHGNHFKVKAGERSSKKFKSKATVDL